ncbi:hypothetical protein M0R72_01440 [Candidatus Pacearchaeota archaeon]|jgi:hypothetical protein|nr:hypothetical protein [Candidatus Pacearchaeota archaeon]
MTKPRSTFGSSIPELKEVITQYGCGLGRGGPPYVVVGQYFSKASGPIGGILAAAQNEIHARIILREVNKNGSAVVHRTEHHSNPTFSIAEFKKQLKAKMEAQKLADEQAEVAEKLASEKPAFKLELVKP